MTRLQMLYFLLLCVALFGGWSWIVVGLRRVRSAGAVLPWQTRVGLYLGVTGTAVFMVALGASFVGTLLDTPPADRDWSAWLQELAESVLFVLLIGSTTWMVGSGAAGRRPAGSTPNAGL